MLPPVYFRPRHSPDYAEFDVDFMLKDPTADPELERRILQQFPKSIIIPDATKGIPIKYLGNFITILSTDIDAYLMINSEKIRIGTGPFTLPCREIAGCVSYTIFHKGEVTIEIRSVNSEISYAFSQIRVNLFLEGQNFVLFSHVIIPSEPKENPNNMRKAIENLKERGILFDFP